MRPVGPLMIFLLFTLLYLIIKFKDKLIDLIEKTFNRQGSPYLACYNRNAFFTSETLKSIMHGDALTFFVGQYFYLIWHQVV